MDIVSYNSEAWDNEVSEGSEWTTPVSPQEIALAKQGQFPLRITPQKPIPPRWYMPVAGKRILCLASGGGQQGPVLAAMGAQVTVFDNSLAQLAQDALVARREFLEIALEQGDMANLSVFADESFDCIINPMSNCFIPNLQPYWNECARVLKKGGTLIAAFWNPVNYLFDVDAWQDLKRLRIKYKIPYSDMEQLPSEELRILMDDKEPLEYGHSLEEQIAGQIEAGFAITGFYEDSYNDDFLTGAMDTIMVTKATKAI